MGEVVVSSSSEEEEGMVVEFETEKDIGSSEVVRWEEFLPRMVLSVLLVEADDSTRQIIAALLRKCSYRVAAVPDGLMAWETLKDGHHNIDLILTEVELPSISGYALLTLVMEHDVYKNIPVIMMSSHDSISMVLNCLLKGAADFLIKPVRKNELRNLWQHVWKRQTYYRFKLYLHNVINNSSKLNSCLYSSSDYLQFHHEENSCSSCTTPCLEAESAHMQNMQLLSQLKYRSASNLSNTDREDPVTPENKTLTQYLFPSQCFTYRLLQLLKNCAFLVQKYLTNGHLTQYLLQKGTLNNGPKTTSVHSSLHYGTSKFEFNPQLELSIKRLYPSSSKNQGVDERYALNHSHASAFAAWSPKLSGQQQSPYPLGNSIHSNPDVHDSKKNHRCSDETTCNSADQKNGHQQNNTEPVDQVRHGSPSHVDIFARERRTNSDAQVMTCEHGPEPHNTGRGLVDI
ncbi:two-component response regulator APRR [Salix suchowensis]|nr:two-component response regulator APRR [Salix suchowensis]